MQYHYYEYSTYNCHHKVLVICRLLTRTLSKTKTMAYAGLHNQIC